MISEDNFMARPFYDALSYKILKLPKWTWKEVTSTGGIYWIGPSQPFGTLDSRGDFVLRAESITYYH